MKVLALDVATSLGWAYQDGTKKPKYGTEKLHNTTFDGAGMRFVNLYRFLDKFKDIDLLVYEKVEFSSTTRASQMFGGYLSTLQIWAENNNIPYTGYAVGTIKKYWTGKGSAKKDAIVKSAREKGLNPATEDEADALAVLYLAKSEIANGEDKLVRSLRKGR